MSEIIHERPGVYSSYDASTIVSGGRAVRTVGVAAKAVSGTAGQVMTLTSYSAGVAAFGEDLAESPGMSTLLRLLFSNGAATVMAVRVGETGDTAAYEAAFQALGREDVQIMICDSSALEVQQALRSAVEDASSSRRERIALVGGDGDTTTELVERASALNSERMVLVGPDVLRYRLERVSVEASRLKAVLDVPAVLGASADGSFVGSIHPFDVQPHHRYVCGGVNRGLSRNTDASLHRSISCGSTAWSPMHRL